MKWLMILLDKRNNSCLSISFLILFSFYFPSAQGQLPNTSASWGKKDTLFRTSRVEFVGRDSLGGIYVMKERVIKGLERPYILEHFDSNFFNIRALDLKKRHAEQVLQISNRLYLISSRADRKQRKTSLFVSELNRNTLAPVSEARMMYEIDLPNEVSIPKSRFEFRFSPDSSKIFGLITLSKLGDKENYVSVGVLKANFQLLWQKKIMLPYPAGKFRTEAIRINNEGNVYLLGKMQNDYDLLSIRSEGDSVTQYPIRINGCHINSVQIEIQNNDNLYCAGFYSETGYASARGIFYMNVNMATQEVKVKCNSEFDLAFMLKDMRPMEFQWTQNRAEVNESPELYYYMLDKILVERDGSIALVGEQRYRYFKNPNNIEAANAPPNYYPPRNSSIAFARGTNLRGYNPYPVYIRTYYNTPTSDTYNFVANDILVAKLDPSGQIVWCRKISKSQNTVGDEGVFSSYLVERIFGKICFFFDDDRRNISLDWTKQPKTFNGKKSIVSIVSLDSEGNQFRQWINNSADIDVTVIPKMSKLISGNELILFGRKQHHQQIGRLTFR